jgi:hypothetical protein
MHTLPRRHRLHKGRWQMPQLLLLTAMQWQHVGAESVANGVVGTRSPRASI